MERFSRQGVTALISPQSTEEILSKTNYCQLTLNLFQQKEHLKGQSLNMWRELLSILEGSPGPVCTQLERGISAVRLLCVDNYDGQNALPSAVFLYSTPVNCSVFAIWPRIKVTNIKISSSCLRREVCSSSWRQHDSPHFSHSSRCFCFPRRRLGAFCL